MRALIIINILIGSTNSCSKIDQKEIIYHKGYGPDSTIQEIGMLVNGRRTGLWIELRKDLALVAETYYNDDMREGPLVLYNSERQVSRIENYHLGKLHGEYVNYSDGRIAARGQYKAGQRDGKWELYYFGKLARKVEYKDGEPVKVEEIIKMPPPPKFQVEP